MKKTIILIVIILLSLTIFGIDTNTEKYDVNSLENISLNGVKQWVLCRGEKRSNPVLLFLHGGPGFTHMPFAHKDSDLLEKHFIVVNWDQFGAGKSFQERIDPKVMNTKRFLNDTYTLITILKKKFKKKKIFLIGYSWGSVLGLYTAINHPEDLHAYIGMGQAIDLLQGEIDAYNYTMQKSKEANNLKDIKTLTDIGIPPFKGGFQSLIKQRILLGKYGGAFKNITYMEIDKIRRSSPYYNKTDQNNYMRGYGFSQHCLWNQLMTVNFFNERTELKIPVYFFEGRYDYGTPFALVEKYIKKIKAPDKEIIWFEKSGHFLNLEETEKYQREIIKITKKNKK